MEKMEMSPLDNNPKIGGQEEKKEKTFESLSSLRKYLKATTVALFISLGFATQSEGQELHITTEQAKEYTAKVKTVDSLIHEFERTINFSGKDVVQPHSNLGEYGGTHSYDGFTIIDGGHEYGKGSSGKRTQIQTTERVLINPTKGIYYAHNTVLPNGELKSKQESIHLNYESYSSWSDDEVQPQPVLNAIDFEHAISNMNNLISQIQSEYQNAKSGR